MGFKDVTAQTYRLRDCPRRDVVLSLENVHIGMSKLSKVAIHASECVAITGDLATNFIDMGRRMFGDTSADDRPRMWVRGREMKNARYLRQNGIGYVSVDRRRDGMFPNLSILQNVTIRKPFQWYAPERVKALMDQFVVAYKNVHQQILHLSGGNQQRVMVAREFLEQPAAIVMCEPTRGIDVHGKYNVYEHIYSYLANGGGVLLLSQDPKEVASLANTVFVLKASGAVSKLVDEAVSASGIVEATGQ